MALRLPPLVLLVGLAACTPAEPTPDPAQPPASAPVADTTHTDWARFFAAEGAQGTIVLLDVTSGRRHYFDPERAAQPFIPASTFKVYNSLAALETGVVPDVDSVFAWDGVDRSIPAWNQDHSLRTGIAASAVWVYQEVARRIGEGGYRVMFALEPYGNNDAGGGIDRFWLDGALRISADEQVAFLDRLRRGALAFAPEHQTAVREIMQLRDEEDFTLYGKTGWATTLEGRSGTVLWEGPDLGWFVGWVETPRGPWVFALNLEADPASDVPLAMAPARPNVVYAVLEDLGLYTPAPEE